VIDLRLNFHRRRLLHLHRPPQVLLLRRNQRVNSPQITLAVRGREINRLSGSTLGFKAGCSGLIAKVVAILSRLRLSLVILVVFRPIIAGELSLGSRRCLT